MLSTDDKTVPEEELEKDIGQGLESEPELEAEAEQEEVVFKQRSMSRQVLDRLVRNRAAVLGFGLLAIIVIACLLAPVIAPEGYNAQNLTVRYERPSWRYPAGTDNLGRNILVRMLYGGRVSLWVGFASTLLGAAIGIIIGLISGNSKGRTDSIIMGLVDIVRSIPSILIAITIAAALGTGVSTTIIAIGISTIPIFARLTRAPILQIKNEQYIEAARAIGVNKFRIMLKHLLPNILSPLIVQFTISVALAIMVAAALSFLGLGVQPPVPEWGAMMNTGRTFILDHPYMVTMPGIALALTVIGFNLFGNGLRDCLDPRLKI